MRNVFVFVQILILMSSCSTGNVLDRKFNFDTFNRDFKEIEELYVSGEITEIDFLGLGFVAMDYQKEFNYEIENKTYSEIIQDVSLFRNQGGIIETTYVDGEVLNYEILSHGLDSIEYGIRFNILNDSFPIEISKIILIVENAIGTRLSTYLYENKFLISNNDTLKMGLEFDINQLKLEFGKFSLVGSLNLDESSILKNLQFRIFTESRNIKNELALKTSNVKYYQLPQCFFTDISNNSAIENLESNMKQIVSNIDVLKLKCR